MLSGLSFELASPSRAASPDRGDVACFIGYVARRHGVPLPASVRETLRLAGWVDGVWARSADSVDALTQMPVAIESWDLFDRLYAWDERPLRFDQPARCATYLGAAVRSFFASGGRRAYVIRVADPWPYLEGDNRIARRSLRLAHLVPAMEDEAPRPFNPQDPRSWRGLEHLYGLADVSHVCLPDLADACSREAPPPRVVNPPPPPPEVFTECSAEEPALDVDSGLRFLSAPRCDADGYAAWSQTVAAVRGFLAAHRRDALLLAALPLPQTDARVPATDAYAQRDWLSFLRGAGLLEAPGANEARGAASAFVQLLWPWLQTRRSGDLPQRLEPAEGLLAGRLAHNAITRGTFRSVAGARLAEVIDTEPRPDLGTGSDSPSAQLAERLCLIGPEPDGIAILSDVTSSPDRAWRPGGVSRLMASLQRAARRVGEAQLFEASGELLWTRIRRSLEALLEDWRRAGALDGREAYSVRCGRDTMSQNDLDNGRVRVEIVVQPVASVERITVVFDLASDAARGAFREVA